MNDSLYQEIILEHFKNPQNYGVIDSADIDLQDSNPLCGDEIRIMAKVKNGKFVEISFVSEGCAISKAAASILTEEYKGKLTQEFKKISSDKFLDFLGITLTPARIKCALLAFSTLKKGI